MQRTEEIIDDTLIIKYLCTECKISISTLCLLITEKLRESPFVYAPKSTLQNYIVSTVRELTGERTYFCTVELWERVRTILMDMGVITYDFGYAAFKNNVHGCNI